MSNVGHYIRVFNILDSAGIKSIGDVKRLLLDESGREDSSIGSGDHPWVLDLVVEVYNEWENLVKTAKYKRPSIIVERPFGMFYSKSWRIGDKTLPLLGNITALLPGRTAFITNSRSTIYYYENSAASISSDYLAYVVLLRPYLLNDLCVVVPGRRKIEDDEGEHGGPTFKNYNTPNLKGGSKVDHFLIESEGRSYDELRVGGELNERSEALESNPLAHFITALPWLPDGPPDRYVELIEDYRLEYDVYIHSMEKMFSRSLSESNLKDLLNEVSVALKKIEIAYETKRKELRWRGIEIGVGMSLALGSFLLPQSVRHLQPYIASVASTKTLMDGFQWITQRRQLQEIKNDADQWFMWKWSR